jgi:hypothetical protein
MASRDEVMAALAWVPGLDEQEHALDGDNGRCQAGPETMRSSTSRAGLVVRARAAPRKGIDALSEFREREALRAEPR